MQGLVIASNPSNNQKNNTSRYIWRGNQAIISMETDVMGIIGTDLGLHECFQFAHLFMKLRTGSG